MVICIMYIDTHAHINFNAFRQDKDEVIRRSLDNDIWMILVGADIKTSRRALELANKYEKGVYAAVGLHPIHAMGEEAGEEAEISQEEFNYSEYEKVAKFEKVVAIGEIGLDYYHLGKVKDKAKAKILQKNIFIKQLELSGALNLPVIIHCREAHNDLMAILKDFKKEYRHLLPKERAWGVMHCYSGDEDMAWEYFSLGINISFTGLITFSKQWDDLIRKLPNDKFMIETDCPFMTPEPFRGQRNESRLVVNVAKRISEIKSIELKKIEEITTNNAKEFFRI